MPEVAIRDLGQLERGETLGERVYQELRNLLMNGKLLPNEKLSLRSVAEALGVSMMPVRQAVSRLVADGALTVLPNRAVCVPLMTRAKLRELTQLRIEIEGYAAAQSALNRTDYDLQRIRQLDQQFRAALHAKNAELPKVLRLNKELHFEVYRSAQSSTLVAIIEGLWLKVGPTINLDLGASQRLISGGAEKHHERLLKAIQSSRPDAARKALGEDIQESVAFILEHGALPD